MTSKIAGPARIAAITRTGLVRKRNEDSAYVGRWLCAVADGMGGHAAGDTASATVINAVRSFDLATTPTQLIINLGKAVREANIRMASVVSENPNLGDMGSTLTAMLWSGRHMALANVGDSRAYMLRESILTPITEDHILSKLVSNPMPPQIGEHIVRFLDKRPGVSPDLTLRTARPGDRYLLCSDGLSSVLDLEVIQQVLATVCDANEAIDTLVELTYQAGAPDNVTAIIVDLPDGRWHERTESPIIAGAADTAGRELAFNLRLSRPWPHCGFVTFERLNNFHSVTRNDVFSNFYGLTVECGPADADDFKHWQSNRDLQLGSFGVGWHPGSEVFHPGQRPVARLLDLIDPVRYRARRRLGNSWNIGDTGMNPRITELERWFTFGAGDSVPAKDFASLRDL